MRYAILFIVSAILLVAWPVAAAEYYVNDADTTADIYCSAIGNDGNSGMAADSPFATINQALTLAGPMDTIYIDAGTYADTVLVNVNGVILQGADRTLTFIDLGDSASAWAVGITLNTSGITLLDLTVQNCHTGVVLNQAMYARVERVKVWDCGTTGMQVQAGSDNAVLDGVTVQNIGGLGIEVTSCTAVVISTSNVLGTGNDAISLTAAVGCTVAGNMVSGSGSNGIGVYGGANNALSGNSVMAGSDVGIALCATATTLVENNTLTGNLQGLLAELSDNNLVRHNLISNNTMLGVADTGSFGNFYYANDLTGNDSGQFYIDGMSTCTATANNIGLGGDVRAVVMSAGGPLGFQRNYWGTADESSIAMQIGGGAAGQLQWQPYRLDAADTTPGADVVAPGIPAGLAADTPTPGSVTLSWNEVVLNEDGGACSDLAAYHLYRTGDSPTTNWRGAFHAAVGTETTYVDTMVVPGMTYRYRVTAVDNHNPYANESFFSDTIVVIAAAASDTMALAFVDATYTTPVSSYAAGDTAYLKLLAPMVDLDAGAYDSVALRVRNVSTGDSDWVVVVETGLSSGIFCGSFRLAPADSIPGNGVVAADSGQVLVADTGGAGQVTDSVFITAGAPSTAGPNVWYVNDTDVAGDVFCSVAGDSGYNGLSPTSPHSSLTYVLAHVDAGDTVYLDAGYYYGNWTLATPYVSLVGADSTATVLVGSGAFDVLYVSGCTGPVLMNLRVANAMGGYHGLTLNGCAVAYLEGISATGNGGNGIRLQNGSNNATLTGCALTGNGGPGLGLSACNNVAVSYSMFYGNQYGISATSADGLLADFNRIDSSSMNGIDLPAGSDSAAITANVIVGSGNCGISGAPYAEISGNTFAGNMKGIDAGQGANIRGNLFSGNTYGLYVMASEVVAEANEFGANSVAGIYLTGTPAGLALQRNNVAGDTVICNASGSHNLTRNWWGTVDTGVLSARIQGGMAHNVQYLPFRFQPIDTAPAADRVAPAAPDTIVAYAPDTESIRVSWAAVTQDEDSLGACGDLNSYRLWRQVQGETSWTEVTMVGAGTEFYDDYAVSTGLTYRYRVTAFDYAAPYPNESWYSSIAAAMLPVDTGGANLWYVNDASLASDVFCTAIGNDLNSGLSADLPKLTLAAVLALLSPGDTVYIDNGSHTANASIPVSGVALVGADPAMTTLSGWLAVDTQSSVYLANFCVVYGGISFYNVTTSTISNVQTTSCDIGIWVIGGSGNTITGCLGMDDTVGIRLDGSTGNLLAGNRMNLGFSSGYVLTSSSNNLLLGNSAQGNTQYGFSDSQGVGNIVTANDAYGNGVQYAQMGANSNIWRKNNLGGANGVYCDAAAAPLDFTQNWWSTTDTAAIMSLRSGSGASGIVYAPFRLSAVDTAPGADTVAPQQVTGVLLTGNETSVTVQWDYPSLDEEGNGLGDLAGYRIWRSTGGSWMLLGDAPDWATDFTDTTASHAVGGYYRVAAYDNATQKNIGWYSTPAGPSAPNRAPVAVITGDSIAGSDSLVLSAVASGDSDADALSYYWWIEWGSPGTLTSPNASMTTCTGMAAGWYAFGLSVSDSYGGSDTTYHYVDVFDATVPDTPTLSINYDEQYATSETVTLSISPAPGQEQYVCYMKIGTDPALTTGVWEPFAYLKEWGIAGGDGDRYLYVALGNLFHAQSGAAADSIILDRVAPAAVTINADTLIVADPATTPVNLTFATSDSHATVTMRYADAQYVNGWYWSEWTDSAVHWVDPYGDTQQVVELQVQDAAGNIASDSIVLTITALNYPQPASGFYGYGTDGGVAELFWNGSYSTNVAAYLLYSDSATGTMNYATPLAVLGSGARAYTVSGLVPDTMYVFGLRVVDTDSDAEQNQHVLAWVQTFGTTTNRVYAYVDYPIPGMSINGIVPVQALVDGDLSGGAEVLFQYRAANTANPWTAIGNIVDSPPYMTSWNTTGLADGDYELQAVARRQSNHADADQYPASVIITKSGANAAISQTMTTAGDTLLVQKLNSNATDTQRIVAGSEGSPLQLQVPPGILSGNATISVKLFSDTATALRGVDRTEFETGCTVIDVSFSNRQSTFNDSIVMRIPYDDANNDGIVDGTGIRVYLLRVLYFSTTFSEWRVVPKADMTIDTPNKTIIVRVSHFSKFATGKVTLGGDLGSNTDGIGDGQVNDNDLARFNRAFGARSGNPHFNDAANIVRTGASANRVDEEDVFQMGANYGTSQ